MSISKISPIYRILDIARWAPSGDNSQPWRFKIISDHEARIYIELAPLLAFNRDYLGPYLAGGMLLENIRIAASVCGGHADIQKAEYNDPARLAYDVRFVAQASGPHELLPYIATRSVCRLSYKTRPLEKSVKDALQQAVGEDFEIIWYEGARKRQLIPALFVNAKIRMFSEDIFNEYTKSIDWDHDYSETRMPSAALGLSRPTRGIAYFLTRSWKRFYFLNKYLSGYIVPVTEMDIIPGIMCGAHCVMKARVQPQTADEYVRAGAAVQRFWLTATKLGLLHQPSMTPLIFSQYALEADLSSERRDIKRLLQILKNKMLRILGGTEELNKTVWMGRIGYGVPGPSRSGRRSLDDLLED